MNHAKSLWLTAIGFLALGIGTGHLIGGARGQARISGPAATPERPTADGGSRLLARGRSAHGSAASTEWTELQASRGRESEDRAAAAGGRGEPAPEFEPRADGSSDESESDLDKLRGEVAALQQERAELLGEPVEAPAHVGPRFEGSSVSGAVRGALREAKVPGDVEAVDCSEHPCIVLGRLEGDEEDMEEIERAAALSKYRDDVLTLLFWATSAQGSTANKTPETGLFALAFYATEDRADRGDDLDRRIRARVMEYWNTDRPGRPTERAP